MDGTRRETPSLVSISIILGTNRIGFRKADNVYVVRMH
jgi:hypothetical protein